MTVATKIDPTKLLETASKAVSALKQATEGHEAEETTAATIGTLLSITRLIADLSAQVTSLRGATTAREAALRRIANLEVRSASELIEASRWKEVTAELQSLAESALEGERKRPSREIAT
ncbi:hypothetical protein [uncultured Sphingomonas sp.]|uniref:hypothetical protein n=1 Tax=uncultured Sphingomonas sp. TaxID=158754 RepID=UPI0035CA7F91